MGELKSIITLWVSLKVYYIMEELKSILHYGWA